MNEGFSVVNWMEMATMTDMLIARKASFEIDERGDNIYLHHDGGTMAYYPANGGKREDIFSKYGPEGKAMSLAIKRAFSLYAHVNKGFCMVESKYPQMMRNRARWAEIAVGDTWSLVDIKHCYWTVAYKLGFIGRGLHDKYKDNQELKFVRNASLAMTTMPYERTYYVRGVATGKESIQNKVKLAMYESIRNTSYNLMGECMEAVGDGFLSYRTDGIMVGNGSERIATRILKEKGYKFTIGTCSKIDELSYENTDGRILKF